MDVRTTSAPRVSSSVGIDQVPERVRSLSTLRCDYIDLFTIETSVAPKRSAEGWARAVLEEAPLSQRNARLLWHLMGLRLGPRGAEEYVQGWRIGERGANWIRAETGSWYLTAQAVCLVDDARVSLSLSLRYDRPNFAKPLWTLIAGPHQRALPVMLRQAQRLVEAEGIRCQ